MDSLSTPTAITGSIVAALAILVGIYRGPSRLRAHLKTDSEILTNLPDRSPAHALLLQDLERRVEILTRQPRERRDWLRITSSVVAVPFVLLFASAGYDRRDWFGWLCVTEATVITAYLIWQLIESAPRTVRDHRGRRVPTTD